MKIQNLSDVFQHEIRDLYSAENQILEALPQMAEKANNDTLKDSFHMHLEQTKQHIKRLEKVAETLDIPLNGAKCKGMEGLIKESQSLLKQEPTEGLDAALISAAQRVEHYEIAGYGSTITYAEMLGYQKEADTLKKTIDEEEKTDQKLTKIAVSNVNIKAIDA